MFELKDKVALVVGGRGYLGGNFCFHLKKQGATVISADLEETSITATKSDNKKSQSGIFQMNMDVTDRDSVSNIVDEIVGKHKRIDVLVFSASIKPKDFYLPYAECSLEGWQKVIDVELNGAFLVTQKVGLVMEKQKSGSVVLLSSIYGVVGNDQRIYEGSNLDSLYVDSEEGSAGRKIFSHSVYPVVKGGLISLARYLAAYWGGKNIRVNCVSPGGVAHSGENESFVKKYSDKVPLGRKAELDDVSGAVVFLSSNASSYITGQNLIVDGGWTAW